jgi:hypothetical protein
MIGFMVPRFLKKRCARTFLGVVGLGRKALEYWTTRHPFVLRDESSGHGLGYNGAGGLSE